MRDIRFLLKTEYAGSHALIIGIDDYLVAPPLSYAVSDAEAVRDLLVEELGFPPSNVRLLKDGEATGAAILKAYLQYAATTIGLDDRVLVFFAGHGHTHTGIRGEIGYLVPSDGDPADLSTLIRWDQLTSNADLIRAKHMLFIMDACYGGLALTRNLGPGTARFLKDMLLRYSRQVLTAGKADEVVADSGGPIPNHSVFTGHLLQGLQGSAANEDGIITANGLMSYVYGKVATDPNSRQTPHYGYFDGDGDFILRAPLLDSLEESDVKDLDSLMVVPFVEEHPAGTTTEQKIDRVKHLLGQDASSIELHDFVTDEVRRYLGETSEDHFALSGQFSKDELLDRVAKYEDVTGDLCLIFAALAHWGRPDHLATLRKGISRSTDRLENQNGLTAWIELRWYPLILALYSAGIAAVTADRLDSLRTIFMAPVGTARPGQRERVFVDAAANAILQFNRADLFKQLPGHERHFTPMSEYLFKILQPPLDDLLFLGGGYEDAFDDFEVMFSLVAADRWSQREGHLWAPVGRFGWKEQHGENPPLSRLIDFAKSTGVDWAPIREGFFGGDGKRFNLVADQFKANVSKLGWW